MQNDFQPYLDRGITKLHLGCGRHYKDDYINVDLGNADFMRYDVKGDFTTMDFPDSAFDEIRLEHTLEHFQRHIALGLLIKFNRALKYGGLANIVVPDGDMTMRKYVEAADQKNDFQLRLILRHLSGSHEDAWASHHETWTPKLLKDACESCGFEEDPKIIRNSAGVFPDFRIETKKIRAPELNRILAFLYPTEATSEDILMGNYRRHLAPMFSKDE